jgi:signal transduction histidine kinase
MAAELVDTRTQEARLLADLRHDLRTPLTVIGGFAEALADGTAVGDEVGRAAAAIGEEAARLERLVGELEALERLQGGSAGLRPERLDATVLLQETVTRFAPGAGAAGIELSALDEPARPTASSHGGRPRVRGRSPGVERILGNLVANAIAAVHDGGHVWLGARRVVMAGPDARPAVALSVTDDGPGFPPGDVERAFQRFYRGDPSRTGTSSGLGLAIVRELARAHGREAVAENVAPHGARLSVICRYRRRRPD